MSWLTTRRLPPKAKIITTSILLNPSSGILVPLISNTLNLGLTFQTSTFWFLDLLSKELLSYDLLLNVDISISICQILFNSLFLRRCLLVKHVARALYFRRIRSSKHKFRVSTISYIHAVLVIDLIITSSHPDLSSRFVNPYRSLISVHNQVFFLFKLRTLFYYEFRTLLFYPR